ncbi:unnamed protein product [Brachionus calyciflorus]|uniref:Uncharacterized protein n=1 Tax=Brachionus calyciflorus TaxID=104777 RepID=A0A813LXK1_9BILA|nr:unnamed protein product [Brachionus calyciflorus]
MSTPLEVSQILANAKKSIEEKKAQLGLNKLAESKKDALIALKAKIAASVANAQVKNILDNVPVSIPTSFPDQLIQRQHTLEERDRSLNLIIDSEGRTIDKRTGEVVLLQSRMPTLKANIKTQKRDYRTAMGGDKSEYASGIASTISGVSSVFQAKVVPEKKPEGEKEVSEAFFDNRLKIKTAERNKRKLVFNEKGKYLDIANKLRAKSKLVLLQKEIASISKKTGISNESKLALIQPKKTTKEIIPNIEWWDFAVLNEMNYGCLEKLNEQELREKLKINRLIEHPVQMKPPTHSDKKVAPAVMLTKKERKKLRRQNRTELLKEEQEKIRLGLIPPPEPKVKISNLMRVLGTEAVQDPTKVEEYVRNQMAKRQKLHEEQNASRKLTDAEKAAKKKRKLMENTSLQVNVSVYRVKDLSDPAVKFKLEANCNQLHMTGAVLLYKNLNLVVVEGGPKQQRKFRRLMMNRIKWAQTNSKIKIDANDENAQKETNTCALVWEGVVKTRSFGPMIFKMCPTISFAREYLKKLGIEHYWDKAQSDSILQQSDF